MLVAAASQNLIMCKWSLTEASWLNLKMGACQRGVEWDSRMVITVVFYGKESLLIFTSRELSNCNVFKC